MARRSVREFVKKVTAQLDKAKADLAAIEKQREVAQAQVAALELALSMAGDEPVRKRKNVETPVPIDRSRES